MKQLKSKLKTIEGVGVRTTKSLIEELLPAIEKAQANGYKLNAIHTEVNQVVEVNWPTFKTTLYRLKSDLSKDEN